MSAAIETETFASAEALVDALRPLSGRWTPEPSGWIFRGQAEDLPLLPAAMRPNGLSRFEVASQDTGNEDTEPVLEARRSNGLLHGFARGLDESGLDIPGDSRELRECLAYGWDLYLQSTAWPLVALAQHHGIPTLLLDWTLRGLVGAYFAAIKAPGLSRRGDEGELVVWALRRSMLDLPYGLDPPLKEELGVTLITVPTASNPNLGAQSGVLALFRWQQARNPVPLEERVEALCAREPPAASPAMRKLLLPWTEAPKLLRLLSWERITGATMFPGADGVVRALKELDLWDGA